MLEESAEKPTRKQQRDAEIVACSRAIEAILAQYDAKLQVIEHVTYDGDGIAHHTHDVRVVAT